VHEAVSVNVSKLVSSVPQQLRLCPCHLVVDQHLDFIGRDAAQCRSRSSEVHQRDPAFAVRELPFEHGELRLAQRE
jgi:hypothetical protein